jgi:hypothetical protein
MFASNAKLSSSIAGRLVIANLFLKRAIAVHVPLRRLGRPSRNATFDTLLEERVATAAIRYDIAGGYQNSKMYLRSLSR